MAESLIDDILAEGGEILSDTLEGIENIDPSFLAISPEEILASLPGEVVAGLESVKSQLVGLVGETVAEVVLTLLAGLLKTLDLTAQATGTTAGVLAAYLEVGKQHAFKLIQPSPIDPSLILQMVYRGQLSYESWVREVQNHGISPDRAAQFFTASRPILTGDQVLGLLQRNLIQEEKATSLLRELGYHGEALSQLPRLVPQQTDALTHIALWLRGDIPESELSVRLRELGLFEREQETLKTLAFYVPPVQDIIRMAVREAFEEDQVVALGLDQDLPEDYITAAAQQGVSRDWAIKYWRAHWDFPSTQQVFQMFHRDIINEDELKAAFKALDIAPAWQEHLLGISYDPLGRVDIRRAYRLGIVKEDELADRYRYAGSSPEDAETLAKFTVLETMDSLIGQGEARLTTLFRERYLSESDFRAFLARMGRTPEQIDLMVSTQIMIREADHLKALAGDIKTQFTKRLISLAQAAGELLAIGIGAGDIADILREWQEEREARYTMLSLSDIKAAIKAGVIDEEEARVLMMEKGLRPKDVDTFIRTQPAFSGAEEQVEDPEDVEEAVAEALAQRAQETR